MQKIDRRFRSSISVAASIASVSCTINAAIAHYAPEDDDSSRSTSYHHQHHWQNWNSDWDRRWRRNWDNSWAPRDNDIVVRKTYVNKCSQPDQNNSETNKWVSIRDPGRGIPNFQEVHPYLFRGGQPTEDGLEMLNNMGVRTIVNLRSDPQQTESERQLCEHHGLKFINIPLSKTEAPSNLDISRLMDVIGQARENPDRGAVFVHDHLGADRTGCMVAMYRVLADKYPYDRAYAEMQKYGFHDSYAKMKQAVQKLDANAATSNKAAAIKPPTQQTTSHLASSAKNASPRSSRSSKSAR